MTAFTKEEVVLQAKDVSLCYDGKQILRDINFEIKNIVRPGMQQGQVVSLIGRSGIGKTQLFKLLAGLQQPTSGEIVIHGDKKVQAGDMGIIFQNYYLFEWRTVSASLILAAKKNPLLKGKEKDMIDQYAQNFDLSDHLHKYPQELS